MTGNTATRIAVQLDLPEGTTELDWELVGKLTTPQVESPIANKMADWARGRTKGRQESTRESARKEMERIIGGDDWANCRPIHLVELYAMLHERIYGVPPEELASNRVRISAIRTIADMLRRHFANDVERMVDFIRWCWVREEGRHNWRRKNGVELKRMNWRWQFSPSMLTDYRMAIADERGD